MLGSVNISKSEWKSMEAVVEIVYGLILAVVFFVILTNLYFRIPKIVQQRN